MEPKTIALGDLLTEEDIKELRAFVGARKGRTPHNAVMALLDTKPAIMARFRTHGVLKSYGAYLIEYLLKL